jgi:hypothetical protein
MYLKDISLARLWIPQGQTTYILFLCVSLEVIEYNIQSLKKLKEEQVQAAGLNLNSIFRFCV